MKVRSIALAFLLCALTVAVAAPRASAANVGGFIPVAPQTLNWTSTSQTAMTGVLSAVKITSVTRTATGLVASGLAVVNTTTGTIIAPFSGATLDPSGTCPILHLEIGPINLDLLGVIVNVPNPIVIDITAQSGPGNLLGNLLCDVANLLNGNPLNLNQLAALLTQLLAGL